jgi:DNA mismatch repair protein MutL
MAYPDVRFTLEQDDREVFRSSGSGQLADVVVNVLGLDVFKKLIVIESSDEARDDRPAISVSGFASAPDYNRSDRTHITLFINGRWVQDSSLTYAVTQAYHTLLPNGRYPVAVLMVKLDPAEVDVNVHPTKAEVRFRTPNAVFSSIQRAVRQSVVALAQTRSVRGGRYGGYAPASQPAETDGAAWNAHMQGRGQLRIPMPARDAGRFPGHREPEDMHDPTAVPAGPEGPERPRTLPVLRVVGQVGAMYIVAEGPSGMYLIDQHAAHERILYEQFMDAFEDEDRLSQHTLSGQTIDLPASEARLVEGKLDALAAVGFALEPFGPNTFTIRSVPALLADSDPTEVLSGVLDDLLQDKEPGRQVIEDRIVRYVCRRVAVKAGTILTYEQMRDLIRQLERCRSPHTCPHGRPTMLHMSGDQLAREFGRA